MPFADQLTLKWFVHDLKIRSKLIASTMEAPLADLLATHSGSKLLHYFETISQDERLYAIGFCDAEHRPAYKTQTYPEAIRCDTRFRQW